MKKTLYLALALVMCLGLTIPALAAGTTETVVDEDHGVTVTLHNFLRKETNTYLVDGEPMELTIYVVEDHSTVDVAAAPGYKYLDEKYVNDNDAFWDFLEEWWDIPDHGGYAYDGSGFLLCDKSIDGPSNLAGGGDVSMPLIEPQTYTASPNNESNYIEIHIGYGISWLCESDFAQLVPVGGSATTPTQPEQPTAPTTPTVTVENIPASGTAVASTQTVTVDGKKVEFQMYALVDANGNGTNYIKLRDMAQVLNGTKAQFSVGYDGTISVTSGEAYTSTGTEMTTPFSGNRSYTGGAQSIKVNGSAIDMTAITLLDDAGGGYNYFKLRDLGMALGFNVGWSSEQGVFIESDKPYVG